MRKNSPLVNRGWWQALSCLLKQHNNAINRVKITIGPGVLTSVGQSNCEPPVSCSFNSRRFLPLLRQSSLRGANSEAAGRFGVLAISPQARLGAVYAEDGYIASAQGQSRDNNDIISFKRQ